MVIIYASIFERFTQILLFWFMTIDTCFPQLILVFFVSMPSLVVEAYEEEDCSSYQDSWSFDKWVFIQKWISLDNRSVLLITLESWGLLWLIECISILIYFALNLDNPRKH